MADRSFSITKRSLFVEFGLPLVAPSCHWSLHLTIRIHGSFGYLRNCLCVLGRGYWCVGLAFCWSKKLRLEVMWFTRPWDGHVYHALQGFLSAVLQSLNADCQCIQTLRLARRTILSRECYRWKDRNAFSGMPSHEHRMRRCSLSARVPFEWNDVLADLPICMGKAIVSQAKPVPSWPCRALHWGNVFGGFRPASAAHSIPQSSFKAVISRCTSPSIEKSLTLEG